MANEFKRMQKLAGIITESQVNKKTIKSKRFLKENDENLLSQNDLNELEEAILDVYQDWLDLDDHADEGGYVWDTEYHGWVNLYDFVISMIYRGVNPSFLAKLESKIQNVKNDDGSQMDLTDYIETYHDDWIQNVEKAIREDIPAYFEDDEELNEFKRTRKLASINEAMRVNFQGKLQNLDIPQGWYSLEVYQDQDPEEDIEIESYGAPMEGWDEDHLDVVTIMKTPEADPLTGEPQEVKYYVATYISFGDFTKSEQFDNLDDAKAEAISIMDDLKSDWGSDEDDEELNEGDTDYDRAKDAKRLGKKGEKNIYGAGVEKGEEIEKKKMKMSELKAAIKELALSEGEDDVNFNDDESLYDPVYEAKKKKKVADDIEDIDLTIGDTETTADIDTTDVDPDVKAVQDALTQAQAAAEKLGDEKLTDQIGNTITFFTRTHIVDRPTMTTESNIKKIPGGKMEESSSKIKNILSKIGDIEEKIYNQYGDDEIDAKFDYASALDNIKKKYKDDEIKMYNALVSHLNKLKLSFSLKEVNIKKRINKLIKSL